MAAPQHLCQPLHDSTLNIAHSFPSRHQRGPLTPFSTSSTLTTCPSMNTVNKTQGPSPTMSSAVQISSINHGTIASHLLWPPRHFIHSLIINMGQPFPSSSLTTPSLYVLSSLLTTATHHSHSNHHFSYNLRINVTRTHHKRCGARWKPCTSCTTHHKHTSAQLK